MCLGLTSRSGQLGRHKKCLQAGRRSPPVPTLYRRQAMPGAEPHRPFWSRTPGAGQRDSAACATT